MGKLDLDLAKLGNLPVNWPKLLLLRPFQNGLANVFSMRMCSECHST